MRQPITEESAMVNFSKENVTLLCILLICQISRAAVSEHLDFEYYTAYAYPNRSLLSVISEASPIHENGRTFNGHTHWNVHWHFWWYESPNGRCRMTRVNTDVAGVIRLPRVINPTAKQKDQFNKYVAALRVHELGHYENGKQAAMDIDREILALPEMENCKTLGATANDLGNCILKEYNAKDIQYDMTTEHGKMQGATLPN
jgi:predicted secreted Zn-dependent protease